MQYCHPLYPCFDQCPVSVVGWRQFSHLPAYQITTSYFHDLEIATSDFIGREGRCEDGHPHYT